MSYLAKLGALTDELVELVTSTSTKNEPKRFHAYRESTLRAVRQHNLVRTNQFDVDNQLRGLEERFRVQHREGLADAFKQRLDALEEIRTKWHPEIFHFLLEMADQPAQKTNLHDLELLRQPQEDAPPALTWADIADGDGWSNDPDLWKSIDYSDSSDDGYESEKTDESEHTSVSAGETTVGRQAADLVVALEDDDALKRVQDSQAWRSSHAKGEPPGQTRKVAVTEFQVVREVLFMLQGLPTTLFQKNGAPDTTYQMSNVLWETYQAIIMWYAEAGRSLSVLRRFVSTQKATPLLQVLHTKVMSSLRSLDIKLEMVEKHLVAPKQDAVISLISLQRQVRPFLGPLQALSDIMELLDKTFNAGPFRYLELLFEGAGAAQAAGKLDTYGFLGRIFFECFEVYLRPIRLWMQKGELIQDDNIFFISESSTRTPLGQIWQEKYKLRRSSEGNLHVPAFLQPSAARIFTAGKSIVVLKHLGKFEPATVRWTKPEPVLDFDTVCPPEYDLAPFPELFETAFDSWIKSKHMTTSEALKQVLFDSCKLEANMTALEHLYFMADGAVSDAFSLVLFDKIDAARAEWQDQYYLTGLAREAFSQVLDADRLLVTLSRENRQVAATEAASSVRHILPAIRIQYRLAWPTQMIVTEAHMASFQEIFVLLLQIRRAISVLTERAVSERHNLSNPGEEVESALYLRMRLRLLWFCNYIKTYLVTLVLRPAMGRLQRELKEAVDVDAMIEALADVFKSVIDSACMGTKLGPIKEGILDVLDLCLTLHRLEASREARIRPEASKLSASAAPLEQDESFDEDDEMDGDAEQLPTAAQGVQDSVSYRESMGHLGKEFERHIRFICSGLRGVARASGAEAAGKWELLAEMLDAGLHGKGY